MIGLGIISYRRFDYVKQCLQSCKENNYGGADKVVLVEDDHHYTTEQLNELDALLPEDGIIISKVNGGVASAKNTAVKALWGEGCTEFCLMEEDILMKDHEVCKKYSTLSKETGVEHFNFALHGDMNKGQKFEWLTLTVYPHCVGAFSYYTKKCFLRAGMFDEKFFNAWEHVFHTLILANDGLTSPFWKFADHPDSNNLLEEIPGSIEQSSIRPRSDWQENIKKGQEHAIEKYGFWLPPRGYDER